MASSLRFLFLVLPLAAHGPALRAAGPAAPPVTIDYFYEPGCDDCQRVSSEILPELRERYEGLYALRAWDLGVQSNYTRWAAGMERLGVRQNAHVFMIVGGADVLAGPDAIARQLFSLLDGHLAAVRGPPRPPPDEAVPRSEAAWLRERMRTFTFAGVALAGFLDGINPCAISTLVFLISVLSISRVGGRRLLAVGAAFCAASFLTYTALGFGLLRALHLLANFRHVQRAADLLLILVLCAMALYSFRDAFRFRRTGRARDVTLQLPDPLKQRIHRIVRRGFAGRAQTASAFALGAAVTGIESVCTGQVYVPTLALVVRTGTDVGRGAAYLLLYNLMFIAPLVAVFVLVYQGMRFERLTAWSRRNVVISKTALGCFFAALAALMAVLA